MSTHGAAPDTASLAADLAAVASRFVAACLDLAPVAAELADLEARLRAAQYAAGTPPLPGPVARASATDVALGALAPLRPYVPFVSAAAAERAAEALREMPCGAGSHDPRCSD